MARTSTASRKHTLDRTRRIKGTSRTGRLQSEAKIALLHLELTNADADAARWAQLRAEMLGEAAQYDATGAHLETLTRAFDETVARALGKRRLRLAAQALRAGRWEVTPVGSGTEQWTIELADGTSATALVPVHHDDPGSAQSLARRALAAHQCPGCRKGLIDVGAGEVAIGHKAKCPAASFSS